MNEQVLIQTCPNFETKQNETDRYHFILSFINQILLKNNRNYIKICQYIHQILFLLIQFANFLQSYPSCMNQNNLANARTLFNQNELMILQTITPLIIIPEKLTLTIFKQGNGQFPKIGNFIRVRQDTFIAEQNQNLNFIKNQRITYVIGRDRLIEALQIVLPLLKQSARARVWCHSDLAYGNKKKSPIPNDSNLIIDLQIMNISSLPLNTDEETNRELLIEIYAQAADGDNNVKKGKFQKALKCYQMALTKILSQRFKQTKQYLFDKQKLKKKIGELKVDYEQQLKQMQEVHKRIDYICIKTIQICFVTEQYLKVIKYSHKCLKQPRLQNNARILDVRIKTFLKLNQLKLAKQNIELLKQFHKQHPGLNQLCILKDQLQKQKNNQLLSFQYESNVQSDNKINTNIQSKSVIESQSSSKLSLKNKCSIDSQINQISNQKNYSFGLSGQGFQVGKK